MKTLRHFGSVSEYQRREESVYDAYDGGHPSTSLPIALGMAAARDLNREDYHIVPIISDASLASGLALEALDEIGIQKHKMIIVFNDSSLSSSNKEKMFDINDIDDDYVNKISEEVTGNAISLGEELVSQALNPLKNVKSRTVKGGCAPSAVKEAIRNMEDFLNE